MLRGGIIGLGNVALGAHVPGWMRRTDVAIVAVTDVERTRASAAEVPAAARWYDSVDDLLTRAGVDFVDICTPPSSHASVIAAALARRIHVLCEKPLVCSDAELAPVRHLAADNGCVVHTVHNWHHAPIITKIAELIGERAIGRVERVVWRTLRTAPAAVRGASVNWRLDPALGGGGVLTDHGWHVFYVVPRWIGEAPVSVTARLETRRHQAVVEDTATVQVRFPTATADIFLTWAAESRKNVVEVIGSDGRLAVEDDTVVLTAGGAQRRWACPPPLSDGSVHPDWFDPVIERFVGEITGVGARDANFREASLCAVLESAARESSKRDGRPIAIGDRA
jgi:predicted dehydrogenase